VWKSEDRRGRVQLQENVDEDLEAVEVALKVEGRSRSS
jgi:hypothetical protein